jgi:Raf kinase inhibitor-like YbhB/YbcL family protein
MNISPPFSWTPGPAGTLSYAIFFRDLTGQAFNHSAIWDIPGCTFELPEDVDQMANPADVPGAKQCRAYNGQFGYAGPCAPGDPNPRTYQFELYAIDVATIPELTTDSSLAEVQAALDMHSLGSATLTVIEDEP